MLVITVIADPAQEPLTQAFADSIAHLLRMQGVSVERRDWLAGGIALDLFTPYADRDALDGKMQEALRGYPFDTIVQPAEGRRKKLLLADMESTIITCECLDELAEIAGIRDKIAAITERAMNGQIDFEAALRERVGLLKNLPEAALQRVMDEKVRLMPGAKTLVATMKKHGATCWLVSGGFEFYTSRIRNLLGFDEARANRLEVKDSRLTGQVIPPILGKEAKLAALREACATYGMDTPEAVAVGDGANDLSMLLAAGLGVAFHAKPTVQAQARHRVNHADLSALLFAQGYRISEFA